MVDLQGQAVIAVLTRAPSARGKTRLFAELGCAPDEELLAALLLDTLEAVQVPWAACVVCYTPASAEPELRALLPHNIPLVPQRGEDLGGRMRHVFDDLLAWGAASVILIGSDLPALDRAVLAEADGVLRARPDVVVLGPAMDGGYYLMGATRTPTPLFDHMSWGTPEVLAESERRARASGLTTVRVAATGDIDTEEDLRALIASSTSAPRTRRAAARLS